MLENDCSTESGIDDDQETIEIERSFYNSLVSDWRENIRVRQAACQLPLFSDLDVDLDIDDVNDVDVVEVYESIIKQAHREGYVEGFDRGYEAAAFNEE